MSVEPAPARALGAATAGRPRGLLAQPNYRRIWIAGGVANSMRWLELLIAGIFTFNLTGSTLMVALVTVARTLPSLLLGAFAGALGEALDRKYLLLGGLLVLAANAGLLCVLAATGTIEIWQIALGAAVSGVVMTGEMAVRRRMIGEVVAADMVGRAIAFDSVSGSFSRMLGPLVGGVVFETVGLGGGYLIAAVLYLVAALGVARLVHRQVRGKLGFARLPRDIAEAVAIVRRQPVILAVVLVSIITNMFGFSYSALIAPIGLEKFAVSPALVGVLAAAEPFGAVLSGLALSRGWFGADHPRRLIGGSFTFLIALVVMALAPWFGLAFAALLIGGLGTARYAIMQTSLALAQAPPELRSRVMGLVTMSIGTGPLGMLAAGVLSEAVGPPAALVTMAGLGLVGLTLVRLRIAELRT